MIDVDVVREWMNDSPHLPWMKVAEDVGFRVTTDESRHPTPATDQMDAFDLVRAAEIAGLESVEDLSDVLADAEEWGADRLAQLVLESAVSGYAPHAGPYDIPTLLIMISGRMDAEGVDAMVNYRPEIRRAAIAVVESL